MMIMKKPKIKINLVDKVNIDDKDKTDEQMRKKQHIQSLLLTLLSQFIKSQI